MVFKQTQKRVNFTTTILIGTSLASAATVALCFGKDAEPALAQAPMVFSTNHLGFSNPLPPFSILSGPAKPAKTPPVVWSFSPRGINWNPKLLGETPLHPGVYKTEPYTCLVVVPGPTADDKFVHPVDKPDPAMPIANPDLQFVPWPKK